LWINEEPHLNGEKMKIFLKLLDIEDIDKFPNLKEESVK
jgi:hypothetical protein